MRLWGGRFGDGPDARMADFTRSIEVDAELALDDIAGSIAHVRGLHRAGLVTAEEAEHLERGLVSLRDDVVAGSVVWDPALEDVHMNLETMLTERVGSLGGKLHTGRSRNDQVATDLRLWTRRTIGRLDASIVALEQALVDLAEREGDAVLPGTTHIQPAQPVLLAHHLLAYVEMLERDRGRFADARRRLNVSPLGAGALAGAGYPLDRATTAAELGFDGVTANSLDAVSDRDFVVEVMAAAALAMVHLSRLAEEITWWSNPRFGFVRVADAFSTGSSMMPNKKNPDPAELVRGRAAGVIGALAGMLALIKGLPLAYQRDLQEDKPAFFAAVAYAGRLAGRDGRPHRDPRHRPRSGCAPPPRRVTPRRRPSPMPSWGVASRSGRPTTSSAGWSAARRPRGSPRWRPCRTRPIGRPWTAATTRSRGSSPGRRASRPPCAARPRSTARSHRRT